MSSSLADSLDRDFLERLGRVLKPLDSLLYSLPQRLAPHFVTGAAA